MTHDGSGLRASISSWAAWAAPAALSLYLKMVLLVQVGTCINCFRIGRQPLAEKLAEVSFFRNDLLVGLLLVPPGLWLAQRILGPRAGVVAGAAASATVYVWLIVQWQSLESVGTFVSAGLLRDGLAWGWANPGPATSYLTPQALLVLIGGLVWIAAAGWWGLRRAPVPRLAHPPAGLRWAAAFAGTFVLAGVAVAWIPDIPVTPYHRSALSWAFLHSRITAPRPADDFAAMTAADLAATSRALTRTPQSPRDPRYWGAMRDADVLFFVFETGPAECLPIAGDLSEFPTLAKLRERAFISPGHYSTAPLTNRTWLSIFASWYPSPAGFDRTFAGGRRLPGVVSRTAAAGYTTALYTRIAPDVLVPGDTDRLRALGFRDVKYLSVGRTGRASTERPALEADVVDLMKADLAASIADGQRFMATFFPLVGHAPWTDVTNGRARTVLERGRALIALQDRWLGELVEELERHDRLDHTVIVVTSDHGLRTRKEDPDFKLGMIDEITFRVPLLIYAPQALAATVEVPWVTSHVDIAPTVLDLLGLERDRDGEQGAPVWDPGLADRIAFQPASLYLGSDGLARDGLFFMYGYLTDRVFASSRMRFAPEDEIPRTSAAALETIDLLQRFQSLQDQWSLTLPGAQ